MDPGSGAAIQRVQHDQASKPRFRTYRFGIEGAYHRTFWPATASEKLLQPKEWTRTSEGLRAYPVSPGKQPVIEPTGLLYAIAAAALNKPGDTADMLGFRRRDTRTVRITVLPSREVSVRYDEAWPTGTVQRSGKIVALRLSLRGMPAAGGNPDDDGLELLGLRGRTVRSTPPHGRRCSYPATSESSARNAATCRTAPAVTVSGSLDYSVCQAASETGETR